MAAFVRSVLPQGLHLPLSRRQVRGLVGALWLLDAALQTQPEFFTARWWRRDLAQAAMGEPSAIAHSILWAVALVAPNALVWNSLFVAIEAALGLCLITNRLARPAILLSIPWALGVWWVGEGFGLLPTGFGLLAAGSPGPVLLYPLLGILAWPGHGASKRAIGKGLGRGVWLALWSGQALLHLPWRFSATQVLSANVLENTGGPSWLVALDHAVFHLVQRDGTTISAVLAVAEIMIGFALFHARYQRIGLAAGILLMLVYWTVPQDFGHLLAGGATDPSSAPLMVVLAFALWPRRVRVLARSNVPSNWTADADVLELASTAGIT